MFWLGVLAGAVGVVVIAVAAAVWHLVSDWY